MSFIAQVHLKSGPGYSQHITAGRHALTADEPESLGGKDEGPSPFQLVLSGLAACTSITFAMYAQRKGWSLGETRIAVRMFDQDGQRRIERLVEFDPALSEEQRARLLEIAEKTPVTKALREGFSITTTGSTHG
jgi:putative redox protein